MNSPKFTSHARRWQSLARDVILAIDRLETSDGAASLRPSRCSILLSVSAAMDRIRLEYCDSSGQPFSADIQYLDICFSELPKQTDVQRDDDRVPANGSIDRAICKAAADMLSWKRDPETCELTERQRYCLFVRWAEGPITLVYEWAYGLWDE